MHGAAFARLGIDADYAALDVPAADLGPVIAGFRAAPEFLGANVTVPHKRAVAEFLDEVDTTARGIGAVNTIVRTGGPGSGLVGRNTDAQGFLSAVDEVAPSGRISSALLLGAGGSARAVAWALLSRGVNVSVYNRSPARAEELVKEIGPAAGVGSDRLRTCDLAQAQELLAVCDLLVNSTSVGMVGGPSPSDSPAPWPLSSLHSGSVVIDLVYRPAVTPLLRQAAAAGVRHLNGVAMLVHQGAAAFSMWTGRAAPVEVMRRAVLDALG